MPIEFRCSQCNQLLRVPEDAAGKSARCPRCQALMVAPASSTESTSPLDASPFGAPAGGAAEIPAPAAQVSAALAESPFSAAPVAANPVAGNPFAGDQGSRGSYPVALPPAAENPFSTQGSDSLNPYASPAPAAYQAAYIPSGPRPGLPWDYQGHGFAAWWETTKLCAFNPSYAFSIMRQYGGMGSPMLFCGFGMAIGAVGNLLWQIPLIVGISFMGAAGAPRDAGMLVGVQIGTQVVQSVVGVLLGATLGLLIGSAIVHVSLMIVGGARQGFETTLRAVAFAQGATGWLNILPCFGPLIIVIWVIALEIIGIARAHETTLGKAALAVFLPMLVCGGIIAAIVVIALGVGRLN
jgi:phage FluMu protein Com